MAEGCGHASRTQRQLSAGTVGAGHYQEFPADGVCSWHPPDGCGGARDAGG